MGQSPLPIRSERAEGGPVMLRHAQHERGECMIRMTELMIEMHNKGGLRGIFGSLE